MPRSPSLGDYLAGCEQTLSAVPMAELLASGIIPAKFAQALECNQKLAHCCRQIDGMTARLFKSDKRLPYPDIFVATCGCGRDHMRVRCDPVRIGAHESEAEKIANATSILNHPFDSGVRFHD